VTNDGGQAVWKKLGVTAGDTLVAVNPPDGFLDDVAAQTTVKGRAQGHSEVAVAMPRGLVDDKVAALDPTWTALRLVWRRQNRPPRP
jgi:hypothetical protein